MKTSLANASKQEGILREQVLENEKNQKEIQRLVLKQMAMKTEIDKLTSRNEKYRKEMGEKNKYGRELNKEILMLVHRYLLIFHYFSFIPFFFNL